MSDQWERSREYVTALAEMLAMARAVEQAANELAQRTRAAEWAALADESDKAA